MSLLKILMILVSLILLFLIYLLINTLRYPFGGESVQTQETLSLSASPEAIEHLAGGLKIPTISAQNYDDTDFEALNQFKAYLNKSYPNVYDSLEYFTINNYGLVFHWKGKNPDLKPILFLSHYDVVPVVGYNPADSSDLRDWDHPPFSGAVSNGRIYGRGSLDMKGMLFSIMEAADALLKEGFLPEQDIWFAFGHDEEVGGQQGAYKIATYFKEQNITFDAVFDEGGIIADSGSALSSIRRPMALIGLGEKGYLSLKIKVLGQGGHSSMPVRKSSLVYAAEIVEKLNTNQMPARIIPPVESFLNTVGGEMDFLSRFTIANRWLLESILLKSFGKEPSSNALIRTTTALTMMKGSDAPNVIASEADIIVNFRLLPGDSVQDTIDHVKRICSGYDVVLETVLATREASALTPEDSKGFKKISEILPKLVDDVIVSSYLTIGGTDAYKYQIVSDNIYRFMPVVLSLEEQRTIHNENESISIENYGRMISFFKEIMRTYHE